MADKGSRGPSCGLEELQLDFSTMSWVLEHCLFTIDVFAMRLNRLVPRYFSKVFKVKAEGQDFFQQEWGREEFLWCNPPPHLFVLMRRKLVKTRTGGWPCSTYQPPSPSTPPSWSRTTCRLWSPSSGGSGFTLWGQGESSMGSSPLTPSSLASMGARGTQERLCLCLFTV